MSIHRRNPKRDSNEDEIVNALVQCGATVAKLSSAGVPDLLIGFRGATFLADVKNVKGRGKRLTAAQVDFFGDWRGAPIGIVTSIGEALRFVGALEADERGED